MRGEEAFAVIKTMTFACIHFIVAFSVAYLLTGSLTVGGAIALAEPLCNTVAYHLHEIGWRRLAGRASRASALPVTP